MKIGILAVQGAFIEHENLLCSLGAECVELRKKSDISDDLDGLILPGGESTVQGKLLNELDMFDILKDRIKSGLPVMATCAGLILLSETLSNDDSRYFQTLPVTTRRNAYGRQLGSFKKSANIKGIGDFEMVFIRAPYIESVSDDVEVLASVDNHITAVRYKNQLGLTFHPELSDDTRLHQYFLSMIE
ncbi:MAG: pyridoxal 5'-phosphate synthase glutaminase subunit PdxT [Lachnospiraceae bacterium]|nr:pyridoxal 5'-phosphate synthase glutaminase subunit PdxT [Lachnospiraceae bacterium]